jgi:hypothetical protein
MKAFSGFILTSYEDADGNTSMVPYLPIVSSSDIINVDPIQIDEKLTLMSERWTLAEAVDGVSKTSYVFSCKYNNLTSDNTGEDIGSSFLDASVQYDLYRNGELGIKGIVRLDGTKASYDDTHDLFLKTLYLPFALNDIVDVSVTYPYGLVEGLSLCATLDLVKMNNKNLNPKGKTTKYVSKLNIKEIASNIVGPLDLIYRTVDTSYASYPYASYVEKYIPLEFNITGTTWN